MLITYWIQADYRHVEPQIEVSSDYVAMDLLYVQGLRSLASCHSAIALTLVHLDFQTPGQMALQVA